VSPGFPRSDPLPHDFPLHGGPICNPIDARGMRTFHTLGNRMSIESKDASRLWCSIPKHQKSHKTLSLFNACLNSGRNAAEFLVARIPCFYRSGHLSGPDFQTTVSRLSEVTRRGGLVELFLCDVP
jgi:hypothetical protein